MDVLLPLASLALDAEGDSITIREQLLSSILIHADRQVYRYILQSEYRLKCYGIQARFHQNVLMWAKSLNAVNSEAILLA